MLDGVVSMGSNSYCHGFGEITSPGVSISGHMSEGYPVIFGQSFTEHQFASHYSRSVKRLHQARIVEHQRPCNWLRCKQHRPWKIPWKISNCAVHRVIEDVRTHKDRCTANNERNKMLYSRKEIINDRTGLQGKRVGEYSCGCKKAPQCS